MSPHHCGLFIAIFSPYIVNVCFQLHVLITLIDLIYDQRVVHVICEREKMSRLIEPYVWRALRFEKYRLSSSLVCDTRYLFHPLFGNFLTNEKGRYEKRKIVYNTCTGENKLRAPVCKNQTNSKFRGKSRKFDFFHILMLHRLGYN